MANDKIQQINKNNGSIEYKLMSCEDTYWRIKKSCIDKLYGFEIILYTQFFITT